MWLIPLFACTPQDDDTQESKPTSTEADPVLSVTADPPSLDFGNIAIGTPTLQTVSLTNDGDEAVMLTTLGDASDLLLLDATTNYPIPPGGSETLMVTWAPDTALTLDDSVDLTFADTDGRTLDLSVPVVGSAGGPRADISIDTYDVGTVSVGCEGDALLTIASVGTGDLVVSDVALTEQGYYALEGVDSDLPALPWTLPSGTSQTVRVAFTPLDDGVETTDVVVSSNDSAQPVTTIEVAGDGRVEGENSMTWTVEGKHQVTGLVAMNAVAVLGHFSTNFWDAIPVFFDTLNDSGAPYRIAFLVKVDGLVDGSIPYIDETFTTDDAVTAVEGMLTEAGGDNDYLFETLEKGIDENRSWLLDESAELADSRLSLIGINNDVEQSGGNATTYINEYVTYKTDPTDIVMSSIGGDVPRGCSGADPATAWNDAATATGGVFLSICSSDWTTHMEQLAYTMIGSSQTFDLEGDPQSWSIVVYVDGVEYPDGWTYDPVDNQIEFEDGWLPEEGAELRVDYLYEVECPA